MRTTKEEELREEFYERFKVGYFSLNTPTLVRKDFLNFLTKIRREAIFDTTKQIEDFAHKEMKDGNLAYEKLLILLSNLTQE